MCKYLVFSLSLLALARAGVSEEALLLIELEPEALAYDLGAINLLNSTHDVVLIQQRNLIFHVLEQVLEDWNQRLINQDHRQSSVSVLAGSGGMARYADYSVPRRPALRLTSMRFWTGCAPTKGSTQFSAVLHFFVGSQ
jgi:hypothetical protein